MKQLDRVGSLMQKGKLYEAKELCEEELRRSPDDPDLMMKYGTCCQLLGDTRAFREVYSALAPTLDCRERDGDSSEEIARWKKYKKAFQYLTAIGTVFAASAVLCGCYGVPTYYAKANWSRKEEMPALPPATADDSISCSETLPANAYRIVETRGNGRWAKLEMDPGNLDGRDFSILTIVRGERMIGTGMVVGREKGDVWLEVYNPESAEVRVGCGALPNRDQKRRP